MFQWLFPPSCPCDPAAKAWVEERLQWLHEEFDDHAFNGRRVVLPTPEFFPLRYEGSSRGVRTLLDQVCHYMSVIPDLVDLEFISNEAEPDLVNAQGHAYGKAAGTYHDDGRRFIIRIEKSQLGDPMDLVGTIAHELAHVRLMGEGRLTDREYDNELLTDLTVVFFGLGIFLANSPRNWQSDYTKWPGTSLNKPEYMTPPMYGYALAHLAWFQNNQHPAWAKHLNWSARTEFNQASRFLFKTGESQFKPVRLRLPPGMKSPFQ